MTPPAAAALSATAHARDMDDYLREGEARARELGNRGPIRFDASGAVDRTIIEAYWRHGFYVLQNVIDAQELDQLRAEVDQVLRRAPARPGAATDARGEPAIGHGLTRESFRFARPLSDPVGGTTKNKGRHPVKMVEPTPAQGAPEYTIERIYGNLQLMDGCLRLYGHHGLLSVAAAINGPDFVPYNEVTFVKEPGLGVSVAWHRDGTSHWDAPDWDGGAHGFNYMAQLYHSTAANGVWVLPGSHLRKDMDIPALVAQSGSERLEGALPMVCEPGDVLISNRQLIHGSFANTSADRRITLNMGFFPRERVLGVTTGQLDGGVETYDAARIDARCRIIALAIDARAQRFPDERRFNYVPLDGREDQNRWSEASRRAMLRDYNVDDLYI